ncbi:hypothetical protein [Paenibacillus macquariensis]|uniref:DUF4825 domain-containing protein n=1 Tax=Paenibacillus macquariensis TaxID=948756 RepID=A0ABY1JJP3_9BACL|nr:hypothetical protein [Paenibacillus macquariensis]MEC0089769.1 hypothetical protein [Paenibacillus macquariensis]OAB30757.1 hypothetical protein PMSM_21705 [Paenibacillus macquariensis subsp. macquariensis]SIQ30784.1 hypothetical protein SAMN05421578_101145 [Paenibacillus macquariensis]
MNRWILMGCTMLLCIGAVIFLPKLFSFQTLIAQKKGVISVFNPHASTTLSNDNLVDTLSTVPFTLPISHVDWKTSTLSLDMKVVTSESTITDIYKNMAEAISFSFENTPNVNRLMLRIIAEDKWVNTSHLLLAADVSRQAWSEEVTNELRNHAEAPLSDHLKQTFRVTEMKLWLNQFK